MLKYVINVLYPVNKATPLKKHLPITTNHKPFISKLPLPIIYLPHHLSAIKLHQQHKQIPQRNQQYIKTRTRKPLNTNVSIQ